MAPEKERFDPKYDYDGDNKTGTKKDRRKFRENVEEFDTGKPTVDTVSREDLIRMAGIPDEFLDNNTEISQLINKAIAAGQHKSTVGQQKFINDFLNTTTYKEHGAALTAYLISKDKGGEDFNALLRTNRMDLEDSAVQLGISLTEDQLTELAEQSAMYGWDERTLKRVLTGNYSWTDGMGESHTYDTSYLDFDKGFASTQVTNLKNIAYRNGVGYKDEWYEQAVNAVASGLGTIDDYAAEIRNQAATAFPVWQKQIESGIDAMNLASPYIQRMQNMLGRGDVSLTDPTLKQAWNKVDAQGNPMVMGLWDWEKYLKSTDEWAEGEEGHNEIMGLTRKIVGMFGFGY